MSATVKLSEKSCFVCKSSEKTLLVKLKDGTFQGVVCINHFYALLGGVTKAVEKPSVADSK
jgi:hypothetical protein